jgi:tetratricopeptide (TPR) repeat protein
MSEVRPLHKITIPALAALLLLPLAADAGQDKQKKPRREKPNQNQQQPPAPAAPAPPPAALETVERRLWENKTSEARSALNPVAGQAAENAHVAVALGRVLEQEKKYGEAEAQLRKATEMVPALPSGWVYLGEVYLRQKKSGEADAAFRKAADAARAQSGAEAAYYLGVAQQRLRQYDDAVSTLSGARGPEPALVPYQIGVTRAFQENWPAAVEQLDRAIQTDSGLAYAYYYRGLAQEKLGRKDLLINDMERFLTLAPNAPEAERVRAILRAVKR